MSASIGNWAPSSPPQLRARVLATQWLAQHVRPLAEITTVATVRPQPVSWVIAQRAGKSAQVFAAEIAQQPYDAAPPEAAQRTQGIGTLIRLGPDGATLPDLVLSTASKAGAQSGWASNVADARHRSCRGRRSGTCDRTPVDSLSVLTLSFRASGMASSNPRASHGQHRRAAYLDATEGPSDGLWSSDRAVLNGGRGHMYVRVLGSLELGDADSAISLAPVPRTLLAALIARRGRTIASRDLMAFLGGASHDTLRSHIRKIKEALRRLPEGEGAPAIEVINDRGVGYSVRVARGVVDIDRFTELVRQGMDWSRDGTHDRAVEVLVEALSLWRGAPLPEVESWWQAAPVIRQLNEQFQSARIAKVQSEFALGHHDRLVADVRHLTEERPTHAELWRLWAVSVYRGGDTAAASAICERGLRTLRAHGINTEHLEATQQQILRDDPDFQWVPPERPRHRILGEPPRLAGEFVGREDDLAALRELLAPDASGSVPPAVALHGASGIGKSALALKYWLDVRGPQDILIWLPASSPVTMRAALSRHARTLGVPRSIPDDQAVDELWRLLAGTTRWTLVFDDAPDVEALTEYWPAADNGEVIITSTSGHWTALARPHHVLPLREPDSRLFLTRSGAADDESAITTLARTLGGVPIALQAAAASLRAGTTAGAYLASLSSVGGTGATWAARTWRPVLDGLRAESPAAAALACFLAFLDTAPLPTDLLRSYCDLFPEPLSVALRTTTGTDEVFAALGRRLSMTTTLDSIAGVHALTKAAILADLRDRGEYDTWLRTAIRVFTAVMDNGDLVSSDVLYPHVLMLATATRAEDVDPSATVRLLCFAGEHAAAAGELSISAKAYTDAVRIEEHASGRESEQVARIQLTLGMRLRDRGELTAAQQMFDRALRILERRTGPRSGPVSEALAAIGIVLFDYGRFARARACLDRAITIQNALKGVPTMLRRQTLAVYGLVLWRLHELDEARKAAEEVRGLAEREYGDDHPVFATALDNLGKVVLAQGDLAGALALNRRALRIRASGLGVRHPFTALSEYHLSRVLRGLGGDEHLQEARELCDHALEVFRQRLGPEHSHVARCQAELGLVELALGDTHAAVDALTQAHGVALRSLGVDHYETALCRGDLARALFESGDTVRAADRAEDAADTLRRSGEFNDQHPYVAGLCRLIRAAHDR
jgi:tetratricopeptide (TPR) repeat protein/DNA-binding SARP family transcriptional activator